MRKILLICFLSVFFSLFCRAQSAEIETIETSLPQINDSIKYVNALNRLGMLMYEKNIDSTFIYTKKARDLSERLNYNKGKADALNNLGIFFDIKGNLQLAVRYYNEAYLAYKELKDAPNQVQTTMNIAMVYGEMRKDNKAIKWFDNALKAGNLLGRDSINSLVIVNYLLCYPERFTKSAKTVLIKKANSIGQKYHDYRVLLALNQLVADDLIANGNAEAGINLLDETIKDGLNKKLYYFSMDLFVDIGDKLLQFDENKAIKYYIQGLDIADKNSYLIYSEVFAKKLFDFYDRKNDASKAALYSSQLVSIYQKREAVNTASGIDYIDYVFKQQELNVLQQKSAYQTRLLVLIIVVCVSIVFFLIVIGKNLNRTKYLNMQVINQNNQLKQAISALQESQAENAQMMKIIAHDLRNPIAGIWSMTSLLLADENRSPRDTKALNHMVKASDHALTLVSNFLTHNVVIAELKKEDLDLIELVEYCVNMVRDKANIKEQKIILDIIPFVILASREKLWRVISNLITNAIKFSSKGQTIFIKAEQIGQNIRILVEDKGIGIPEPLQEKVFNMFTGSKRKGTDGEEPFGLGLFISKQIVDAHSGKIWFESREGHGTKFFVELPG